jgi:hypothetical protein
VAGKVFGAGNFLGIILEFPDATIFTADVSMFKAEQGLLWSAYFERPFEEELALCQRYYEKSFNLTQAPVQASATQLGATQQQLHSQPGVVVIAACDTIFAVRKRAAPTITSYNPVSANNQWRNITAAADVVAIITNPSERGFHPASSGGGADGDVLLIHWDADAEL